MNVNSSVAIVLVGIAAIVQSYNETTMIQALHSAYTQHNPFDLVTCSALKQSVWNLTQILVMHPTLSHITPGSPIPAVELPIFFILTPSVHKTVMRCFSSCAFFTENRIAVFTKDVQIYLISFYLTFILNSIFKSIMYYLMCS